jgi:Zn-dependent M28 family amino/carboxypeptidase
MILVELIYSPNLWTIHNLGLSETFSSSLGPLQFSQIRCKPQYATSRTITPQNLPENGLFFRADHFSLARRGVPLLLIMEIAGGSDLIKGGGRAAGDQWIADYTGNRYHQTCDAFSSDWDLRGAGQDISLFKTIIEDLGNSRRWPQWYEGSEFKAVRESSNLLRQQ